MFSDCPFFLYDFNHLLSRPLGMKFYSFSSPPFLSLFIIKLLQHIFLKENWFHLSSLICPIEAESLVRALVTLSKWFFFFPTHRLKQKRPLLNLQILLYLKFEIHCWEPQISQLLTHLLSSSLHTLLWTSVLINSVNRLSATYIRNIIYCSLIYRFQLMLFWKKVIQKSIWFLENF